MAHLTIETVREALRRVVDPEIQHNIVDLGLIYDIDIAPDGAVTITMTLTTPFCPLGAEILRGVKEALYAAGAETVNVDLVWNPLWTPARMAPALKELLGIEE